MGRFVAKYRGLGSHSKEYQVWRSMIRRCEQRNHHAYADYGGRGIRVCERWKNFEYFLADMGPRPAGYWLERKNNNEGYNPDNCRWATQKEQANNKRSNVVVTALGKSLTVAQWSELTGFPHHLILIRVKSGWSHEDSVTLPPMDKAIYKRGRHPLRSGPIPERNGYCYLSAFRERHTIAEWARIVGLDDSVLWRRVRGGWDLEEALVVPSERIKSKRGGWINPYAPLNTPHRNSTKGRKG